MIRDLRKPRAAVLAAMATAACLAACTPKPEAERPDIKLYAMDCGSLTVSDLDIFADDGAYKGRAGELVDPCYLIRHPDGDLLWDLGLPEALADTPAGIDIPGTPFHFEVHKKLTDQLAELNLIPADIELISVSHSHLDHIGNANLFASTATWIVDKEELAHAFREEARADAGNFANYSALETAKRIVIEGDEDYDVFGDGSVAIIQAPGHTPGHTILLVSLPQSGNILLTGDMYHVAESRAERRVPVFNTDRAQTLASMDKIEGIASSTGVKVIRQHVTEDFDFMPPFPAALE